MNELTVVANTNIDEVAEKIKKLQELLTEVKQLLIEINDVGLLKAKLSNNSHLFP